MPYCYPLVRGIHINHPTPPPKRLVMRSACPCHGRCHNWQCTLVSALCHFSEALWRIYTSMNRVLISSVNVLALLVHILSLNHFSLNKSQRYNKEQNKSIFETKITIWHSKHRFSRWWQILEAWLTFNDLTTLNGTSYASAIKQYVM